MRNIYVKQFEFGPAHQEMLDFLLAEAAFLSSRAELFGQFR